MRVPEIVATFIGEQHPRLVGLLGLYCADTLPAEELAQETLERICRDWRRVSRKENPAAWTRRVAINLATSHFRRRAAERRALVRLESQAGDPVEADDTTALVVRRALTALPARQRTAVVLRYYLDMSFPEIAEFVDVPLSTAKSLTSRGVERLRGEGLDREEVMDAGHT